jgi:two-component system OmpR family response regulator
MIKPPSLLVVEDDLAVREAIIRVLETEHYEVSSAACSKEALRHFDDKKIDVVILDLSLGQEQGWEIFKALKSCQPDLPIIVTSACSEQLAHSSANQAIGVLEKPFDVPLLLNLLKRASEPMPAAKS